MKLKNILLSFLAIVAFFAFDIVSAASTAPNSYIVNGNDWYKINTSNYLPGGSFDFFFKKNTNGESVYCVQSWAYAVTSGTQKYTLSYEAEAKFAYAMANGYPNKSITGNAEADYFITGLAVFYLVNPNDNIFYYMDLDAGTYRGNSNYYVKEIAKLVKGANNYSYTEPAIKLNGSNNFTLSSDKKYYVSNQLGVSTTGTVGNYTVSLSGAPSGTIVTDVNGNAKTTFGTGEKFLVKVPASSINTLTTEFKVNVKANGSVYKAYVYVPDDYLYQNTAALYADNKTVSATQTLKINLTTEVQISKVDATTSKELPGAKLTVKDSNGKVIETWVSTNEVHVIKGLKPGKYTLTEEIAPDGYVLSKETVNFEIKLDGTVKKVVMKNEKTTVQISKVDATTGEELPGAKLTVKDSNGKVVDTWTSTNEIHVIKGLKVGKYTLTEEIAPDGYVLSTETITFEIKNDGTVEKIVMENELEKKNPIYISKQDVTTGEELAGAHLEIKDEEGNIIFAWVSKEEPFMIEELEPGKYFLSETIAPEGYELSTETVEFVVKEDGTVDGKVIMYNKPETIIKVPSTSSFKTITTSIIGIIVIGLGSMIIYKNYKKNEEY